MVDVAVFGSLMIDFTSYVGRMPKAGETLHADSFDIGFGGKGANQCIAATRLGCKTAMIGKIGRDPYGAQYKDKLIAEGVNTEFLNEVGENSGVALIVVSADGENQIVINANANHFLSGSDFTTAKSILDEAKILICQLETPLPATIIALESFKGFSILNGAPALKLSDDVLKLPNVFCVNEIEAEEITGIKIKSSAEVKQSIEELQRRGCQTAVVTLGKLGAAFNDDSGKIIHVPVPIKVNAVNTVGAGDAFIGALAFFIAKFPSASWTQKIGASVEIASRSVQVRGTQSSFGNFPKIDPTTKNYDFQVL